MDNDNSTTLITPNISISWENISAESNAPSKREGHKSWIIGDLFYVFGGGHSSINGPVQYNQLFALDLKTNTWKNLQAAPRTLTGSTCTVLNEKVYVFGGFNVENAWTNNLYVYDTTTGNWSTVSNATGTPPSPRDKSNSCTIGSKIVVFGGFGPQTQSIRENDEDEDDDGEPEHATFGWFNDTYIYDTEQNSWSVPELSGIAPTPRAAFGMCNIKSKIYIIGGRDNVQRVDDVIILDLENKCWIQPVVKGTKFSPRSFHSCNLVEIDQKPRIILFGGLGRDNKHLNDVHILQVEENQNQNENENENSKSELEIDVVTWIQPTQVNGQINARGFHSSAVYNHQLYVFGGSSNYDVIQQENLVYFNDVNRLTFQ